MPDPEKSEPEREEALLFPLPVHAVDEASSDQRFINFLIDNILMQYGMAAFSASVLAAAIGYFSPGAANQLFGADNKANYLFTFYLIYSFNHLLYYPVCEKFCNGRTVGKWITGTRAVRKDGTALTLRNAMLRCLFRVIPLEPFSALSGVPWHDAWTKTIVIKTR